MRAFLSCLALIVAWALLSSSALVTATPSCSALYDNPTQKYSAGALLATKSVRPRIYGIDGENHCCFFCDSKSKCAYFTYYQNCRNNAKGCMGTCKLYTATATSVTFNRCKVNNGLGPKCYYQSGKKSSKG